MKNENSIQATDLTATLVAIAGEGEACIRFDHPAGKWYVLSIRQIGDEIWEGTRSWGSPGKASGLGNNRETKQGIRGVIMKRLAHDYRAVGIESVEEGSTYSYDWSGNMEYK